MIEICPKSDFPDGEVRTVTVTEIGQGFPGAGSGSHGGISVFRQGDHFYAIDDACTHVGASHSRSTIKDGVIECWLHKGQFCLESGDPVRYPTRKPARVHKVEVRDGIVVLFPNLGNHDVSRHGADETL